MGGAAEADFSAIWSLATRQFALGLGSLHGPDHWQRVERNGRRLAEMAGGDLLVVRLFAVLHDSQRLNESHDPDHGQRAADWARTLRGEHFELADGAFEQLLQACILHDKGMTSQDPTIGSCWDADRFDLTRVGVRPHPRYMSTQQGREIAATGRPLHPLP